MKAIVWTKYGSPDGLKLKDIAMPVPGDGDVLIKIHATTVSAGDAEIRSLRMPLWLRLPARLYMGLPRPRNRVLGQEFSGEVEAVGSRVRRFRKGDPVFGTTGFGFGAYAEYIRLAEQSDTGVMTAKPATMSYQEAAAVPTGALEALYFLRRASIQPGQKILINGAGGSIGTFAVQLAKHYGAEVTGVDRTDKLELLRALGADHVVDYTREDFRQNGHVYDLILDVPGTSSFARSRRSLSRTGIYMSANPRFVDRLLGTWIARTSSMKAVTASGSHRVEDLVFLKELIEAGKIRAVIDRSYPMEEIVEAHRYVDTGQKKGNVVITVAPNDNL